MFQVQHGHTWQSVMCVSDAAWPHLTVCNVCFRCSMALLHSRVSRVFYTQPQVDGALGSSYKLHTIPSVNHHFDVFHWLGSVYCDRWCWCETLGCFIETGEFIHWWMTLVWNTWMFPWDWRIHTLMDDVGVKHLDISMRLGNFLWQMMLVQFTWMFTWDWAVNFIQMYF